MNLFNLTIIRLLAALTFLAHYTASAQTPAFVTTAEGVFSNQTFTVGWEFRVSSQVNVTALGRIQVADQAFSPSSVALYRLDTGAQLAALTVPSTAPAESAGAAYNAHYANLSAPVTLTPGVSYIVAAEALDGLGFAQDVPTALTSPIQYVAGRAADFNLPLPATASESTFPIVRNETGQSYLGAVFKFSQGQAVPPLSITNLAERSVFQRDATGNAVIPISGGFGTDSVTTVEARALPTDGGQFVDWTVIDSAPISGTFAGTLSVTGGRYRIEVRALDGATLRYAGSVNLIGAGEVFVVAGQSNAANFGDPTQTPDDDRVSTVNLESNTWSKAADPMPNAGGTGGSPWPQFGDLLASQEDVPVAIISVAQGGTRVDQWQPGSDLYTDQLQRALTFVRNNSGLRAVLWHQGETDAAAGTSAADYAQRLQTIIAQSRLDVGFDIPWGVALASADPGAGLAEEAAVVAGQQAVINADPLVFQGAATNDFESLGFLFDDVHFNQQGLEEHAARWYAQVTSFFSDIGTSSGSVVVPTNEGVFSASAFSIGWEFTVDSPITVSRLGRITGTGSALGLDSNTAIFRLDTGAAVASATIPAATVGEPLSAFHQTHYAPLASPVTLDTGVNYVILTEALDGVGFYQDVPAVVTGGINYVTGRAALAGEGLPTNASDITLPIVRNETGISYLGATFDLEASTPPTAGGAAIAATDAGVFSAQTFSVGWQFTVSQPTSVNRLGRVTESGASLGADSPVTIYRLDTGEPVATSIVPTTAPGETIGSILAAHYVNLPSPVTLQPGVNYVILTEALDGVGFFQDVPATTAEGIQYIAGRAAEFGAPLPTVANATTLPITRDETGISYLGPIFEIGSTLPPDPEPPTSGHAVTPSSEGVQSFDAFSVGWQFTVSTLTSIDRLGRITRSTQRLGADSSAALYRLDTGAQIATATIPVSSPGEAVGSVYDVHYAALPAPVILTPGINYVVLVEALDGVGFDQDVPATVATGINFITGRATAPSATLPSSANEVTLPVTRNETGISYLGATFAISEGEPPADTTSPTVVLRGPATTEGPFDVQVTFSESVTGLTPGSFNVTNGTSAGLTGSGANYAITITPISDGVTTVFLPSDSAADAAGNGNTISNTLSVSFTSPPQPSEDLPWTETFDDLANGTTEDEGITAWKSTRSTNFGVENGQFSIFTSGGEATWVTEVLQIADAGTVSVAVDLLAEGQLETNQDYIRLFTIIDGVESQVASRQGFFNNGNVERINITGITGNTLQVVIRALTTGSTERYAWDNVSIASVTTTPPSSTDQLGAVDLPSTVSSPDTVTLEIPYSATERRAVQIRLHDVNDGYSVLGQADTTVEPGDSTVRVPVSINVGRTGDGYLWSLRLLPIDWVSIDEALDAQYADVTVVRNTGGNAIQDRILDVNAPATAERTDIVTVTVDVEATQRRDLVILLHDVTNGFRTVGRGQLSVDPGISTKEFTIGIAGDARLGGNYVWAIRLFEEGETDYRRALSEVYREASITERDTSLVNFAVLPGATATHSSTFGGIYTARLARDGNTDGDWRNGSVTHTKLNTNAWWEVDLGSVKDINYVLLWNRTDCCAERLAPYHVLVSNVPFVSQDLDESRNQPGVLSQTFSEVPSPTQRVNVNRSGRYVRIQLSGANYLSLAEVEVYGANEGPVNGVAYEYYEGELFRLPDFDELSPVETGTLENFQLNPQRRDSFFSFRYRACLRVPQDGTYKFFTYSDDGSKLIIDGQVVVDNDGLHNARERSGSIFLTAGMHPLELQFFHRVGPETLVVSWSGPGFSKRTIPNSSLTLNESGISPGFHHAGRRVASNDNADGDLLDVTAEYALGLDSSRAQMSHVGLHVGLHVETADDDQHVNVWYERPARLAEITYTLEHSQDLDQWVQIEGPEITTDGYGWERVSYQSLERLPEVNADKGFVRLRIAHRDWQHETTTPVSGWYQTTLSGGHQTHGLSLNHEPVFASTIASIDNETGSLTANGSGLSTAFSPRSRYYMEITSGQHEGHRIDVDLENSGDQVVAFDWHALHNTLTGLPDTGLAEASFVIRPHWTLAEAYPKARFTASVDPAMADQLLFFNGQGYDSYFLLPFGDGLQWTSLSDTALASADRQVIPPGHGCFIKRPEHAPSMSLTITGHLREGAFVQPLSQGHNFLAPPRPLDMSPLQRGLTVNNGFLASNDPQAADQLQVWLGDQQGYTSYMFLEGGNDAWHFWTDMNDTSAIDANEQRLIPGHGAVFLRLATEDHRTYRVPGLAD